MLPLNHLDFRGTRKLIVHDARMTEQLEKKHRLVHGRGAKHKHVEQLSIICSHGRDVIAVNHVTEDKVLRLGLFLFWP
jgi:ATP-dependent helicase STH1/SNF2